MSHSKTTKKNSSPRQWPQSRQAKAMSSLSAASPGEGCAQLANRVNELIGKRCATKQFVIESSHPCTGGGGAADPVDLVVVIDTSGSMSDEANSLSSAADAAIQAAKKSCPSDLRVVWLGIEGTWPGTKFSTVLRDYLNGLGVPDSSIVGRDVASAGEDAKEDGAAAVIDLSEHFDWRPGAARAILYLGDEALEGGDPQNADDIAAADAAINAAKNANVQVFTYAGTGIGVSSVAEYARLASATSGQAFSNASDIAQFQSILEDVICAANQGPCRDAKLPELRPCFQIRWGDGSRDQMETEDFELLCIRAWNPYTNVTLRDVTVVLTAIVDDAGNSVAKLPDGTPSVMLKPSEFVCFGDLPPCDGQQGPRGISRELVLKTSGALEGRYFFRIGFCFTVELARKGAEEFVFELVKS